MEYVSSEKSIYNYSLIYLYIIVVYCCIFIIPSVLPLGDFRELQYSKIVFYIFTIFMAFCFIRKMKLVDIFICLIAVAIAAINRTLTPLSWISTVLLCRLLSEGYADYIKKIILSTKMNIISLVFTGFYSIAYGFSTITTGDYQIARTAVYEVNQSGLAILCLGLIIRRKRGLLGSIVLCFGAFTLSRNYLLALLVLIFINWKNISKALYKLYNRGWLKFTSIIFFSTIFVVMIGAFYLYWWNSGQITYETGVARINNLKDYSNFYRFSTNISFFKMIQNDPIRLLIGYSDIDSYREGLKEVTSSLGIASVGNVPHNFMLSYIRLYGISSIFLIFYISKVLNMTISKNNIGIYLAICLYPIFMSAGFNTWWLYLTVFTLLVYSDINIGITCKKICIA